MYVLVGKKARKQDPKQNGEEEDIDDGIDINNGPILVRVRKSTQEFYQQKKSKGVSSS